MEYLKRTSRIHRKAVKHGRDNGGKVGRKTGYRKSQDDMREEYAEEIRLLKKGISLRNVSKITNTSVNTLRKVRDLTIVG